MAEQKKSPWDEMVDGIFNRAEARMAELEQERNNIHAGTHEAPYLGYGQSSSMKTGNRDYIDRHYDQKIEEVRKDAFNNAIDSSRHADKDTQAAIRVRADNWRSDKPVEDIAKPKDMDESARIFNQQRSQGAKEKEQPKAGSDKSDYNINVKVEFETKEKQQKDQREQKVKDYADNKSDMFSRQQDQKKAEPGKEKEAAPKTEPEHKEQADTRKRAEKEEIPKTEDKEKAQPEKAEPDAKTQELRSQFAHQRWDVLAKEDKQEAEKSDQDKEEKENDYSNHDFERWLALEKDEEMEYSDMEQPGAEVEHRWHDDYDDD